MKLEQAHIDQIRIAFQKMLSREDLLHLLNEVKSLIYGEKVVPFQLKQLTWYANPKLSGKRYSEFRIRKKSGAERSIHAPVEGLKAIQKTLSFVLQCVFEPHKAAMGFVRDKSIVDNARLHEGRNYVYNIDLKDFFSSVDQARVWKCLQLKPFNLSDSSETKKTKEVFEIIPFIELINEINPSQARLIETPKGSYLHLIKLIDGKEKYFTLKLGPKFNLKGISLEEKLKAIKSNTNDYEVYYGQTKNGPWATLSPKKRHNNKQKSIVISRLSLANMISAICSTEMEVGRKNEAGEWVSVKRNVLPQGAPTSPVLTNVICQRLDFILSGVAKRFNLTYSRYADDITFSSMHNVYQPDSDFLKELHRIIAEQGFHIKVSKTRLQKNGHRKEVTGLLVNEKANVQQRYIKQLRMWLYYWERYGYDRAYSFFIQQYLAEKVNGVKGKPDMANVIGGKLDFLKMVKGAENELYLKLKSRFDKLTAKIDPIVELLDAWENKGIEDAMNLYYKANI
jgi:hypothetical protein